MRIISGSKKGKRLHAPKSQSIRPTEDRIKESLFNILGPISSEDTVLDLCSGSGAIALEFLSRGANSAALVDISKEAIEVINKNIKESGFESNTRVFKQNADKVIKYLYGENEKFDYIYFDPPYESHFLYEKIINRIAELSMLKPGGLLIVESDSSFEIKTLEGNLVLEDKRQYRDTIIYFIRNQGD